MDNTGLTVYVDIATEWNLKVSGGTLSNDGDSVDIATEWNLKHGTYVLGLDGHVVDIATEWNLKMSGTWKR